jgi:NAD(P)H-hydrate repair Nnr-like enzyme with NAD(P)H-hydrate dehydratase domain
VGEVARATTETASETVAEGPVVVVLKAEETNLVESGLRTSREKTGLEWSTTTRRPTS